MFFHFFGGRSPAVSRRAVRRSAVARGLDLCEDRVLLSASALRKATPAVDASDFAGDWKISSNKGDGDASITQQGNTIKIHLTFNFQSFDVNCTVTDNHAKGKINSTFLGGPIRGKFATELKDADTAEGTARIKKSVEGKLRINFTATKVETG